MATAGRLPWISPPPRRCVLVAEDDTEMRRLLVAVLARDGYRVSEATDAIELLTLMTGWESGAEPLPHVIVTDERLPGGSGLALLEAVRGRHLPIDVVLITAFGDEALHARARRHGALAVLDKPFDLDDLRTLLAQARAHH